MSKVKFALCAVTTLLAIACNHGNGQPMTPANGAYSDPAGSGTDSTAPGSSDSRQRSDGDVTGSDHTTTDVPPTGPGTTGSGTPGSGSSPGGGAPTPGSGSGSGSPR